MWCGKEAAGEAYIMSHRTYCLSRPVCAEGALDCGRRAAAFGTRRRPGPGHDKKSDFQIAPFRTPRKGALLCEPLYY